jgi:predicted transcriptional regulator
MDTTVPVNSEATRTATFKVSLDEYRRLERVAREDDRSVSAVLRLAVRDYLEARESAA